MPPSSPATPSDDAIPDPDPAPTADPALDAPSDPDPAGTGPDEVRRARPGVGSLRVRSRRARHTLTLWFSVVAALAAAFAPVTLTGSTVVDVVERALVVGIVTFVGAHAHRWSWFVAGALVALPARGASLLLVVAGLAIGVFFTRSRRRSRPAGAVAVGLLLNGVFRYTPDALPAGASHALAAVAVVLLVGSGLGELSKRHRRTVRRTFAAAALVVLVAVGAAGLLALTTRTDVEDGTSGARRALAAVRQGDSAEAQDRLDGAQAALGRADDAFGGPLALPLQLVPGLAQQATAVQGSLEEAVAVSEAADELVSTDYDRLRYEGRIDLATVSGLAPRSEEILATLTAADRRLHEIGSGSLLPPLRTRLDEFAEEVGEARDDAALAADILAVAPGLLGEDRPQRVLVVFLTPAELRGAGGFVGNFVELTATDGDVDLTRSGRIRELIDAAPRGQRTIDGPADYLARYGGSRPADNLQDVTLSPHWPSDASVYGQLYPQSGGAPVDVVVGVDPTGMAGLLALTGPVAVPGFPGSELTADNAVEALTTQQYLLFGDDSARREDFLEAAIRATFDRLTEASLPAPSRIGEVLGPVVRGRHVQLWSPATAAQALFEHLEADGAVEVPAGQDGLAVVQQNVGNNKIDAYLEREVAYRATVDASDATLRATVAITLRNTLPEGDLPRIVAGNNRGVPVGTNLTSLALHTPHTVTRATIDGREVKLGPSEENGLRVWDTPLIAIPRGGTVTLEVQLAGTLDLRQGYVLRYLPQPMARPETFSADVGIEGGRFSVDGRRRKRLTTRGPAVETVALRADVSR